MTPFEQYLISIGYKRYRNGIEITDAKDYHFSTMEPGGLYYEYIKDGFITLWFGLNERHKPPTLVGPRKNLYQIINITHDGSEDDNVNRLLKEYSPEQLYEIICS